MNHNNPKASQTTKMILTLAHVETKRMIRSARCKNNVASRMASILGALLEEQKKNTHFIMGSVLLVQFQI